MEFVKGSSKFTHTTYLSIHSEDFLAWISGESENSK
jgi:hypothetical protein